MTNPPAGREATDPKLEASAVEPIGDGTLLLVADDKTPDLVVVETATGRQTGQKLSLGKLAAGPIAPKWEGMARDGDTYYVIGSHSGKKVDEHLAHARLLRFKLSSTNPPAIVPGLGRRDRPGDVAGRGRGVPQDEFARGLPGWCLAERDLRACPGRPPRTRPTTR